MFRPTGDRLAVLVDSPESVTAGGIILPAEGRETPRTGSIAARGAGVKHPDLVFGARVILSPYAGDDVAGERRERTVGTLRIVPESAVLALIEG